MAGIKFTVSADLEQLRKLRDEVIRLKTELKGMDKAADPKAFKQLEKQLGAAQKQFNRLSIKVSEDSNTIRRSMDQVATGGSNMGKVFAAIGGTAVFAKLAHDIVKVRGEFQQLDVSLRTLLQSKDKADALMAQLVETAAKTPFELRDVAQGAKQLIAYGIAAEDINETLIRLGNIASGLNLPLERMTYLYGTTFTQGRLYARDLLQFTTSGIPMLQGLADTLDVTTDRVNELVSEGAIGFEDVKKVLVSLTSEGGKFYNLMQEQSKTITGRISNLKDEFSIMLNEMGTKSEGVIYGSINGLQFLIKHYEDIGRVLVSLVATYGTYKAALIAVAAAKKASMLAQMVSEWYTMGKALGFATANQILFNSAAKLNPYILIGSALVGAISAVVMFGQATNKAADAQQRVGDVMGEAQKQISTEMNQLERLRKTVNDSNKGYTERANALDELKKIVPDYHASLTNEGKLINDNSQALDGYIQRLKLGAQIRVASDRLGQTSSDESAYIASLTERQKMGILAAQNLPKYTADMTPTTENDRMRASGLAPVVYKAITGTLQAFKDKTDQYSSLIDKWTAEMLAIPTKTVTTGGGSPTSDQEAAMKAYEKATIDQAQKLKDGLVDIKKAETTDKIKLIEIERDAAIQAIKDEQAEYEKTAKAAGVKNVDTGVFAARIEAQSNLAKAKISKVNDEAAKDASEAESKRLDDLLKDYKTFEGKRAALDAEYIQDVNDLTQASNKATTDAERQSIQDTLIARKAAYQEALAGLENEALQSSAFYRDLFQEISEKGYRTLTDLALRTAEVLASAKSTKGADGKDMITMEVPTTDAAGVKVKKAVTITVEEFTRLQEKVNDVNRAIEERNPFIALLNAYNKYKATQATGDKDAAADAMEQIAKAAGGSMNQIQAWGNMIGSVFGDQVSQGVDTMTSLVAGVADLGVGIGRMAAGDVLGGLTQAASGVVTVFTQIVEITKQQEAEQFALMTAEIEYQRQLDDRRIKLIESRNELAAYANDVELLNDLIKAGYLEEGAADYWSKMSEKLKEYQNQVAKERSNQGKLWDKVQGSQWEESGWVGLNYYHYKNSLQGMSHEQVELLYRQGKLTKEAEKYYEQWLASDEAIQNLTDDIALTHEEMASLVTGMSFDEFLNGAMDNLAAARGNVADFADFTEDTIRKALLNSFKYQVLAQAIQPLYNRLANAFIAGTADKDFIDKWSDEYEDKIKVAWEGLSQLMGNAGIPLEDDNKSSSSSSGSSRSFQTMSQDTGDALEGRFTALQMSGVNIENRTMELSQGLKDMMAEQVTQSDELRKQNQWLEESRNIQLESLAQLTDIAKYTKVLPEMSNKLDKVVQNTDRL